MSAQNQSGSPDHQRNHSSPVSTSQTGNNIRLKAFAAFAVAILSPMRSRRRPAPHQTEHHNLRRTIEAIIWRHRNGAKWRSIPSELGPWWMAAQTFIRCDVTPAFHPAATRDRPVVKHGVWDRLLEMAQADQISLGMTFLDGTNIRAHQKAAGAPKKGRQRGA